MNSTFLRYLLLFAKPDVDNLTFVFLVSGIREKYKEASARGFLPKDQDLQECHKLITEYLKGTRGVFNPELTMDMMMEEVRAVLDTPRDQFTSVRGQVEKNQKPNSF